MGARSKRELQSSGLTVHLYAAEGHEWGWEVNAPIFDKDDPIGALRFTVKNVDMLVPPAIDAEIHRRVAAFVALREAKPPAYDETERIVKERIAKLCQECKAGKPPKPAVLRALKMFFTPGPTSEDLARDFIGAP